MDHTIISLHVKCLVPESKSFTKPNCFSFKIGSQTKYTVNAIVFSCASYYVGCPQGVQSVSKNGLAIFFFFFFFMVASNLHINLFIKLSPLLVGMYCSDCLQQKRPNENPLLAHISRGRGPPHPYLCDVKSSFDLFIKPGLNCSISLWRPYCVHVLDSSMLFQKEN